MAISPGFGVTIDGGTIFVIEEREEGRGVTLENGGSVVVIEAGPRRG